MNRWQYLIITATVMFFFQPAYACTIFLLHDQHRTLVAHSFDWHIGDGQIVINKRGLDKTAMLAFLGHDKPAVWRSRFGSLTIGWVGQDLPTIGINEQGLLTASLLLEATEYPEPDGTSPRSSISQGQIKQYLLDTCSTVVEALAALNKVKVVSVSRYGIHYFLADAAGDSAIFEFLDGQIHVYHGADLSVPVLTNSTYPVGLASLSGNTEDIKATDTYGLSSSEVRFAQATKVVEAFPRREMGDDITWTFSSLNRVHKTNTQWQSIFDLRQRRLYLRTLNNPEMRMVALDNFDLNCTPQALYRDLDASSGEFLPLDKAARNHLAETTNRILRVDEKTLGVIVNYPETLKCIK